MLHCRRFYSSLSIRKHFNFFGLIVRYTSVRLNESHQRTMAKSTTTATGNNRPKTKTKTNKASIYLSLPLFYGHGTHLWKLIVKWTEKRFGWLAGRVGLVGWFDGNWLAKSRVKWHFIWAVNWSLNTGRGSAYTFWYYLKATHHLFALTRQQVHCKFVEKKQSRAHTHTNTPHTPQHNRKHLCVVFNRIILEFHRFQQWIFSIASLSYSFAEIRNDVKIRRRRKKKHLMKETNKKMRNYALKIPLSPFVLRVWRICLAISIGVHSQRPRALCKLCVYIQHGRSFIYV